MSLVNVKAAKKAAARIADKYCTRDGKPLEMEQLEEKQLPTPADLRAAGWSYSPYPADDPRRVYTRTVKAQDVAPSPFKSWLDRF